MTAGPLHGTLLIVDDEPAGREALEGLLLHQGYRLAFAASGQEAVQTISQILPDLILLDIMMPRMSGFEVCRRLKAAPKTRDIPILMVTALNELGDIERGVESGTDDFLTKPINKLELLTRVKSLLRVRHLKNQLDRTLAYLSDMENRPEPQ
jgi:two-component system alkaline phosphatase synthesis response regulator PhoP